MKKSILNIMLLVTLTTTIYGQTLKDEWVVCNNQGCKLLDPYFSDGVTMKWEGSCANGKANGYGKLTKYKDGEYESTYEGEFQNGIREGKGKFSHKDGTIAIGQFINGQLMGYGSRTSDDGTKYEGEFVNYRQHGKGVMTFANGAKFEGFFVSDRMYTGKFTNFDGKITNIQQYYPVDKINEKSTGYKPEIGVRVTEYFDDKWNRCKQKDASYYRLVTYESDNKPKGVIKDYYISGQLQSEFTAVYLDYDDEGKNFHEGEATWYFKNGKIEQKRYYYNNQINGKNTFFFDNGQKSKEDIYSFGEIQSEKIWDENGILREQGVFENGELKNNKYFEFDDNGIGTQVYKEPFFQNEEKWQSNIYGKATARVFCDKRESDFVDFMAYDIAFKTSGTGLYLDTKDVLQISKSEEDNRFATSTINIPLDQQTDFSIEAKFLPTKNILAYGLLFGDVKGDSSWDMFLIRNEGCAFIGKFEGVDYTIFDENSDKIIKDQANLLKVLKLGDKFIFSVNGSVVKSCDSKLFKNSKIGFSIYGQGNCAVADLTIKEIYSSGEIAKNTGKDESTNWKGNGSGFFINEKGYIATNYHVVKEASAIQVEYFQKGIKNIFSAKVIVTDKQNDLAIIQINDPKFKSLPSIPYVFNSTIKDVGSEVFALGYPIANVMGDEIKFTDGKISSKTGIEGDITVYQISVPIQPGNSGGPLFDNKGNLVGITSSALNKEYFNSENVNYAIKTTYLKNLIDVMPESITLPNDIEIYNKPLTEKIKLLSDFIPIIRVK